LFGDAELASLNFRSGYSPSSAGDAATKNYVDTEVTDSQIDVQDDGTSVLADAEALNFKGGHFAASDDTGGVAGVDISAGSLENSLLENSSVTVNAGDGLKSGGNVSLGGSVGLDVEPADFAGSFVSDDGADNLAVDIGTGLAGDGSGNIAVDESGVDHDALQNFVSNEHVDHSTVSVTGTGALTGGGDLTSSRSIDVAVNGVGTSELDESASFSFSNLGATTITGDLDMQNNNIDDVASIDGGGNDIQINDNLAMNENDITDLNSITGKGFGTITINGSVGFANNIFSEKSTFDISTNGGGTDSIRITDQSDSFNPIMVWNETGSVEAYNALNMINSNAIQDAGTDAIQFDGSANVTIPNGDTLLKNSLIFATGTSTNPEIRGFEGGVSESLIQIDPETASGSEDSRIRFFRDVNTTGRRSLDILRGDGTASPVIELNAGVSELRFPEDDGQIVGLDEIGVSRPGSGDAALQFFTGAINMINGNFKVTGGVSVNEFQGRQGTVGGSDGEALRLGASSGSDFVTSITGGHGRVAQTWNANYDDSRNVWSQPNGNEPSTIVGINNDIGVGAGIGEANFAVGVAASTGTDNADLSFTEGLIVRESANVEIPNGDLNVNSNNLQMDTGTVFLKGVNDTNHTLEHNATKTDGPSLKGNEGAKLSQTKNGGEQVIVQAEGFGTIIRSFDSSDINTERIKVNGGTDIVDVDINNANLDMNGGDIADATFELSEASTDDTRALRFKQTNFDNAIQDMADGEWRIFNAASTIASIAVDVDTNTGTTILPETAQPGNSSNAVLSIGNGGAGFFINSSGEVVVVDEAGNTTTIS
jgi:hypothetical protein